MIIESPEGTLPAFILHYAETVCIPAALGRYTIRPHGASASRECATLKVTWIQNQSRLTRLVRGGPQSIL